MFSNANDLTKGGQHVVQQMNSLYLDHRRMISAQIVVMLTRFKYLNRI
jgi:hypothetical protein